MKRADNTRLRLWLGVAFILVGFLIFLTGAAPQLFSMDNSPVIGFIQIGVFLFGLGMMCLGGYIALNTFWNGTEKTIAAEIGIRLISTGYVMALVAGMADIFGLGTRPMPDYIPFFGHWQARGILLGEFIILVGFALFLPRLRKPEPPPPAGSQEPTQE